MKNEPKKTDDTERRARSRITQLRNHRIEIKLIAQPTYQFKVRDVSSRGAGFLVKEDSKFLNLIKLRQIVDANFISPTGDSPAGMYKAEIVHITKPPKGEHRGHLLVGVYLVEKIN